MMFKSRRKPIEPLPTLVLSDTMRREAMILDLSRAVKLRDMRAVHALQKQLQRLTSRMLAKGA